MPDISIWEQESFFSEQDVVIAGSGFTGLWSALHLKLLNPLYRITIIERGWIPTGASTRNAGFSCFGSPSELIADEAAMGTREMWDLVAMRYKGLSEIRSFFTDKEIEYDDSGGYECFTEENGSWHECVSRLPFLNKGLKEITGLDDIFTISDEKLREFGFSGFSHMIRNRLEGGLHPGKLVQALLFKVQRLGVQVITGIEVLRYDESDLSTTVFCSQGISITTGRLLLCTNAFTANIFPSIDIIPNRGQVLLTSQVPGLKFKGTFHFDRGYYYFRNLGNRLLIGGARNQSFEMENTAVMETTPVIQTALEDFVNKYILPGIPFTITDRWTGIMAMGTQKEPIIKALSKRVFCCVRLSGMGVALAPIAAKEVAGLIHKQFKA